MKEKTPLSIIFVRSLLIVCTLCIWVFIFSNALAEGEVSSAQSHSFTVAVQEAVAIVNPASPIATATGESFDLLHACIRDFAHFIQYFALAACAFGAYLSFSGEGTARYAYIPPCLLFLTVALDEYLQSQTVGRAAEFTDFATDSTGILCGIVLALLIFGLIKWTANAAKRRRS